MLFLFNPATSMLFPPCPLRWATGLLCPGCGTLRALHQLLHGNLPAALALNPLMVVSLPVLGLLLARPAIARDPRVAWSLFAVIIGFGVARNLPLWPFSLLAPH